MLLQQRERFRRYLRVLEGQEQAILQEDVERLEAHVRLEREVLEEIQALQRAIDSAGRAVRRPGRPPGVLPAAPPEPGPGPSIAGPSIPELRRSLERLRGQVTERGRRNRLLLEAAPGGAAPAPAGPVPPPPFRLPLLPGPRARACRYLSMTL